MRLTSDVTMTPLRLQFGQMVEFARRLRPSLSQHKSKVDMSIPAHAGTRITTRVAEHVQQKLQMAADIAGATVNQFVVQAALEKAERVIESESTMLLTRRESLRLLELIDNPPPRNRKFVAAQVAYNKLKSSAVRAAN